MITSVGSLYTTGVVGKCVVQHTHASTEYKRPEATTNLHAYCNAPHDACGIECHSKGSSSMSQFQHNTKLLDYSVQHMHASFSQELFICKLNESPRRPQSLKLAKKQQTKNRQLLLDMLSCMYIVVCGRGQFLLLFLITQNRAMLVFHQPYIIVSG